MFLCRVSSAFRCRWLSCYTILRRRKVSIKTWRQSYQTIARVITTRLLPVWSSIRIHPDPLTHTHAELSSCNWWTHRPKFLPSMSRLTVGSLSSPPLVTFLRCHWLSMTSSTVPPFSHARTDWSSRSQAGRTAAWRIWCQDSDLGEQLRDQLSTNQFLSRSITGIDGKVLTRGARKARASCRSFQSSSLSMVTLRSSGSKRLHHLKSVLPAHDWLSAWSCIETRYARALIKTLSN